MSASLRCSVCNRDGDEVFETLRIPAGVRVLQFESMVQRCHKCGTPFCPNCAPKIEGGWGGEVHGCPKCRVPISAINTGCQCSVCKANQLYNDAISLRNIDDQFYKSQDYKKSFTGLVGKWSLIGVGVSVLFWSAENLAEMTGQLEYVPYIGAVIFVGGLLWELILSRKHLTFKQCRHKQLDATCRCTSCGTYKHQWKSVGVGSGEFNSDFDGVNTWDTWTVASVYECVGRCGRRGKLVKHERTVRPRIAYQNPK